LHVHHGICSKKRPFVERELAVSDFSIPAFARVHLMFSSVLHASHNASTAIDDALSSEPFSALPAHDADSSARSPQVLVLAPHPDDESLGCGGTLKQLTEAGISVDVAFMTRGELGCRRGIVLPPLDQLVLASQRAQEAVAACRILGVRNAHFLNGRDGGLGEQPELSDDILRLLKTSDYSIVFCPWAFDFHPDHSATFDLLTTALKTCDCDPEVWLYEVWSTLHPNKIVSIDSTIESKMRAIRAHASQMKNYEYDYSECFQALARYRGMLAPGMRHAEAFYVCDREAALSLRTTGPTAIPSHIVRRQLAESAMAS
jgi:LmbE family N-acetylglucosaminyl deacetylase